MPDNLSDIAENRLLDHVNGTTSWSPTLPLKLALVTTPSSESASGSEVSGGGYARQTITFAAAVAGAASNAAVITFTNMPAATLVGFVIYDSSASPVRIWYGPNNNQRTTYAGDTYFVPAGALTVSFS